jgi:DNA-binding CsgD family transcriptional regulator
MVESRRGDLASAAFAFMAEAPECAQIEALDQRFRRFVQGQGFCSAMFLHLSIEGTPVAPRRVFGDHDPWIAHYNARNYASLDPTIPLAFTSRRAFTWRQAEPPGGSRALRDFFGEARETWAADGLVVPVHGPCGEVSVVNLLSQQRIDLGRPETAMIEGAATAYASQGLNLLSGPIGAGPPPPSPLTRREQQCVLWMARGKRDPEIAVILNISEHTVRAHLEHARDKLQAGSRPELTLKALTYGYLVPDPVMLA